MSGGVARGDTGQEFQPQSESEQAGRQAGLGQRAARGAAVTLAGQLSRMLLQLGSVVVLARLLAPRDYGLVAMVLVIVGVGEIFRDFGLTNAVVAAPTLSRRQQNGLFWVSTGIGVVLSAVVFAAAPLVALAFGQPALLDMTRVLALTFTVNGMATQYRTHLTRELRFGRLALSDLLGQAVGLGVAIALAALGAGRWALVAQQLAQLGTVLILVAIFSRWLPGRPRRHSDVMDFVRTGSHLASTQVINYISNNLDTLTVAVRFPTASLGLYNRGFQLLMTPLNQLRAPATTVALPILARLERDYERAGDYLRRGQLIFGFTLVPGLALVVGASGPLTAILLGPRWTGVAPILSFLAVAAACETLAYIGFWVYVSRGLARHLLRYTLLTTVLQGVCILGGSIWGVAGVAGGYATAAVLEWPLSLVWLSRITEIPARALLQGAGRILACAVPAGLAAYGAQRALGGTSDLVALAGAIAATAAVYGLALLGSRSVRADVGGVREFAGRMVRRRSVPAPEPAVAAGAPAAIPPVDGTLPPDGVRSAGLELAWSRPPPPPPVSPAPPGAFASLESAPPAPPPSTLASVAPVAFRAAPISPVGRKSSTDQASPGGQVSRGPQVSHGAQAVRAAKVDQRAVSVPMFPSAWPMTSAQEMLGERINLDQALAVVTIFALGLRQFVSNGLTSGYALALVLLPVWIGVVRRYRSAGPVLVLMLATALWGYLLSDQATLFNTVDGSGARSSIVLMVGTAAGIGAILWAREVISTAWTGIVYGAGMVAGVVLGFADPGTNAWKFAWAVPVAVLLLSGAARSKRMVEVGVLVLLALVSVVFDSRSYFATFLLTALLVLWQMRPVTLSRRASWSWTALLMAAIATAVYYLGTTLLINGYLGQAAQARSVEQIDTSGSLLLGGRPELAATLALFAHRPQGFGVGVIANPNDILIAKAGMKTLDYDPNNGYVERFMFGPSHIELHSTAGDLWADYGLVGLAFAVVTVLVVIRGIAEGIAARRASAALVFLCCWTLWNTLFSPLYAADPTLLLTLGLVLPVRVRRRAHADQTSRDPGQKDRLREFEVKERVI